MASNKSSDTSTEDPFVARSLAVQKVSLDTSDTLYKQADESDLHFMLTVTTARIAGFVFSEGIDISLPREQFIDALWGAESFCTAASNTLARDIGLDGREAMEGASFAEIFPATTNNFETVNTWFSNALSDEPITSLFVLPDESKRYFQFYFHPDIKNGHFNRLWIIARDITRPHQAMVELRTAEEHYRTLVERPGLLLVRTTPEGSITYISPHVTNVLGFSTREFIENPSLIRSLIHPEDEEAFSLPILVRKNKSTETVETEYRVRFSDGSYHWIFERQTPKIDAEASVLYYDSVILDIQERKQLENQLRHAQRMETLGTLTGGIAHDFNNYLAAILGQLNLASDKIPEDHPSFANITMAEQAALNCSAMSRRLLSFGRRTEFRARVLHSCELLTSTEKLLRHAVPADIETTLTIPDNLPAINGDFTELQQVLLNLGINARDAMPAGGTITIAARPITVNKNSDRWPNTTPGEYVEIAVTDTGTGIPQAYLDLIFDPYFTTKSEHRGSGLGLSLSYSIIQAHNGAMTVSSTEGRGSTFSMILPVSQEPIPRESVEPVIIVRGSESILVVDDDPMVLAMVNAALTHQGYRVIEARDAREALEKFDAHAAEIDLLLLDYSMHGQRGDSVASALLKKNPQLPVLLTSGYSENLFDIPVQSDCIDFIAKPYPVPELLQSIRNLLDLAAEYS